MDIKSGVNPKLFQEYKFEDHLWGNGTVDRPDLLLLANRCVIVGDVYWMKNPGEKNWLKRGNMSVAQKEAFNKWLWAKLPNGQVVNEETIRTFFSGVTKVKKKVKGKDEMVPVVIGSCPILDDIIIIPFGPSFITYNNKRYLNIWYDKHLEPNPNNLQYGKTILWLLYRSLCNGVELSPNPKEESEILYQQVLSNNFTNEDFKFALYWLAATYKRPGINLLTNLWFCGELEGVGKGTLVKVMHKLIGDNMCGKLSKSDLERGWTNHLMGKVLIEVDEIDHSGRNSKMSHSDWNLIVKTYCNEETVVFAERNVGTHEVINIGNWIFTVNEENPLRIAPSDRRNQMIKTTDDPSWVMKASEINIQLIYNKLTETAAGFGSILDAVQYDVTYISHAHDNDFKNNIKNQHVDPVQEWLSSDITVIRELTYQARDLYTMFKIWYTDSHPGKHPITESMWGRWMGKRTFVTKTSEKGRMCYKIHHQENSLKKPERKQCSQDVATVVGEITTYELTDKNNEEVVVDFTKVPKLDILKANFRKEQTHVV